MLKFNEDFLFGISMSGFQFEMGGKTGIDENSDWYEWVHDKRIISAGLVSGDFPENGPNYWELYKNDHNLMKELGVKIVRVGIEWSRIFPDSTESIRVNVNEYNNDIIDVEITEDTLKQLRNIANLENLEHYKEMIRDLKDRGIKVMVNLNHFTLPLWIHDPVKVNLEHNGPLGWVEKRSVVEFTKYAAFIASELDDYVDFWSTMNEPQIVSSLGYTQPKAGFPPAIINEEFYKKSQKHQAEAHCRAYDAIKRISNKPVGFIYSFSWADPETENDKEAAEKAMYFSNFQYTDMIFKGMVDFNINNNHVYRKDMDGKTDFLGINYYTRIVVRKEGKYGWNVVPGYGYACVPGSIAKSGRPVSDMGWEIYPEGLEKIILKLNERYNSPEIFITENGIGESTGRYIPYYLVSHLNSVYNAIKKGANVRGYMYWSFMDNYEWPHGFSKRFGLVHVDFESKKRTIKPGFLVYQKIIQENGIPDYMENYVKYPYKLL
ncbi:hypothetical protein XO10_05160 [Marinitoga sp. 1135]|uniref:beta-galactosidase BgaS n=1 Tax=Marinitoga sp. 1135 TaxID=1643333 RepID=UPI0015862464|nr:beta-galactosidase BgaS [Marinitoga sp. 1135]NUU95673.1 hypothetical protein [Marinitoga sp. 1135]